MRKLFVAGNWKMNKTIAQAKNLAQSIVDGLGASKAVDVAVIPPFLAIPAVAQVIENSPATLGAQDVYFEPSGAFTGEISCEMLADAGAQFALVGHSERRHVMGETDPIVRKKLDALLEHGLDVILSQHRTQTVAPNIFSDLGIDPERKKILIVKSTQHFYAAFKPISKKILYAGDKGALQRDMTTIPYMHVDPNRFWPFVDNPHTK